jgi:hypothetical protein
VAGARYPAILKIQKLYICLRVSEYILARTRCELSNTAHKNEDKRNSSSPCLASRSCTWSPKQESGVAIGAEGNMPPRQLCNMDSNGEEGTNAVDTANTDDNGFDLIHSEEKECEGGLFVEARDSVVHCGYETEIRPQRRKIHAQKRSAQQPDTSVQPDLESSLPPLRKADNSSQSKLLRTSQPEFTGHDSDRLLESTALAKDRLDCRRAGIPCSEMLHENFHNSVPFFAPRGLVRGRDPPGQTAPARGKQPEAPKQDRADGQSCNDSTYSGREIATQAAENIQHKRTGSPCEPRGIRSRKQDYGGKSNRVSSSLFRNDSRKVQSNQLNSMGIHALTVEDDRKSNSVDTENSLRQRNERKGTERRKCSSTVPVPLSAHDQTAGDIQSENDASCFYGSITDGVNELHIDTVRNCTTSVPSVISVLGRSVHSFVTVSKTADDTTSEEFPCADDPSPCSRVYIPRAGRLRRLLAQPQSIGACSLNTSSVPESGSGDCPFKTIIGSAVLPSYCDTAIGLEGSSMGALSSIVVSTASVVPRTTFVEPSIHDSKNCSDIPKDIVSGRRFNQETCDCDDTTERGEASSTSAHDKMRQATGESRQNTALQLDFGDCSPTQYGESKLTQKLPPESHDSIRKNRRPTIALTISLAVVAMLLIAAFLILLKGQDERRTIVPEAPLPDRPTELSRPSLPPAMDNATEDSPDPSEETHVGSLSLGTGPYGLQNQADKGSRK